MKGLIKSGLFDMLSREPGALATLPPNPRLVAAWQRVWHERFSQTWQSTPRGLEPVNSAAAKVTTC